MPLNPNVADLLPQPAAPAVTQNALGAGAAISYQIVAVSFGGQDSVPSPAFVTAANNAATPNNTLTWTAVPGAAQYRVLKNGNLLASVAQGTLIFVDSAGSAGVAYTANVAPVPYLGPVAAAPIDGGKASYSFAILGLAPATTPTDIFALGGSASKTIRITRLIVSALQTTAGNIDVQVIKRSGGTQSAGTAGTAVANDTNNPAATAAINTYTANPASVGTSLGAVVAAKVFVPAPATAVGPDKVILDFGNRPGQAQVLRGAGQFLCINLNAVTLTGGSVDIYCEWTEE